MPELDRKLRKTLQIFLQLRRLVLSFAQHHFVIDEVEDPFAVELQRRVLLEILFDLDPFPARPTLALIDPQHGGQRPGRFPVAGLTARQGFSWPGLIHGFYLSKAAIPVAARPNPRPESLLRNAPRLPLTSRMPAIIRCESLRILCDDSKLQISKVTSPGA